MESAVEEDLFRKYVADSLHYQAEGKYIPKKYSEIVDAGNAPQDERSGAEMARDLIKELGLEVEE